MVQRSEFENTTVTIWVSTNNVIKMIETLDFLQKRGISKKFISDLVEEQHPSLNDLTHSFKLEKMLGWASMNVPVQLFILLTYYAQLQKERQHYPAGV